MKSPKPLSDRFIASLSESKQRDWIDPLRPDFGLRINPGGSKTWWVRVPINGRRLRLKIGRWPDYTRDEAWDVARDWIKQARRGINPVRVKAKRGITLGKLFERYIAEQKRKGLRYWTSEEVWFRTFDALLKRPASEVERLEIRELLAAKRIRAAQNAENARALLFRVYRYGMEEDLVESNPVDGVRRMATSRARDRILSEEEIRTLWELWERDGRAGYRVQQLALLLGTRHRETLHIRRSLIHDGWIEIEGEHTKSGRAHLAPVTATVQHVLDAAAELAGGSPWLFRSRLSAAKPLTTAKESLRLAREATGIVYTIHDLRRTAYSAMRRLGLREEVIAAYFNHAPKGMRRHYDRWSYAPERQEAARVWHADLERILRKGQPGVVVAIHRQ